MDITLNKKENNEALIKVTLAEADYQPKVDEKVKEYSKKAQLKGFRPGKVPASVIKRMYGKSILAEEVNNLLSDSLIEYLETNNIKIIGEPLPENMSEEQIDWDTQKEFSFEYLIGIQEDFQVDVSDKFKATKYLIKVDDKVMNQTMDDIKKQYGDRVEPEAADESDDVHVDLESVENPEDHFHHVSLEISKLNKKEASKFIGVKNGEEVFVDIKKLFKDPDDLAEALKISESETKNLKGNYKATILHIYRITPAELNQELFDKLFGNDSVKSLEEFKEKVKETIKSNYDRESTALLQMHVKEKLVEDTKINIPKDFIKRWLSEGSRATLSIEEVEKNFEAYLGELKWSFIQNKIAQDAKLDVSHEDIMEHTRQLIRNQFGGALPPELEGNVDSFAMNYLQGENGQNYTRLQEQLFGSKLMDHILGSISVNEKTVDLETFKKKANA